MRVASAPGPANMTAHPHFLKQALHLLKGETHFAALEPKPCKDSAASLLTLACLSAGPMEKLRGLGSVISSGEEGREVEAQYTRLTQVQFTALPHHLCCMRNWRPAGLLLHCSCPCEACLLSKCQ